MLRYKFFSCVLFLIFATGSLDTEARGTSSGEVTEPDTVVVEVETETEALPRVSANQLRPAPSNTEQSLGDPIHRSPDPGTGSGGDACVQKHICSSTEGTCKSRDMYQCTYTTPTKCAWCD